MNLQTDIDIASFWAWWTQELQGLLPSSLKRFSRSYSNKIVVTVENEIITLDYYKAGETTVFLSESFDTSTYTPTNALINPQFRSVKYQTILKINPDTFVHKTVHIPVAAKKNLEQVIGFEIDKLTPFNKANCFYSAINLNRKELSGFIPVLLVVTPKSALEKALTISRSCNLKIDKVCADIIDEQYPEIRNQYNLLPSTWKHIPGTTETFLNLTLNSCMLLLATLCLLLPALDAQQDIDYLQKTLKGFEKETRSIDKQQAEINQLISEHEKLTDIIKKQPNLLSVLNELSAILNDNTWLIHLRYSEEQLEIMGYSPTTLATISDLENSEYFSKVNLLSPLYQDKQTGLERFHISMKATIPSASSATENATNSAEETVQ